MSHRPARRDSFYTLLISAQERLSRHRNRNQKRNPLSTRDPNTSITPTAPALLIPTLKRPQISPSTSPRRRQHKRVIFISSSSPPPPPQPTFNIIIINLSINLSSVDNSAFSGRSPSPTLPQLPPIHIHVHINFPTPSSPQPPSSNTPSDFVPSQQTPPPPSNT